MNGCNDSPHDAAERALAAQLAARAGPAGKVLRGQRPGALAGASGGDRGRRRSQREPQLRVVVRVALLQLHTPIRTNTRLRPMAAHRCGGDVEAQWMRTEDFRADLLAVGRVFGLERIALDLVHSLHRGKQRTAR